MVLKGVGPLHQVITEVSTTIFLLQRLLIGRQRGINFSLMGLRIGVSLAVFLVKYFLFLVL